MFTVSTFIQGTPEFFFAFVVLNGIAQAAAGSYLQTSIISVASLFGPTALQAMMAGQAAVGVAVSAVQVISAAGSLQGKSLPQQVVDSKPEERSAFAFFALSTAFLIFSAGAHAWLIRLPSYKAITGQFSHIRQVSRGEAVMEESLPDFVAAPSHVVAVEKREQIWRVSKSNIIYNVGVAYVFLITLVRLLFAFLLTSDIDKSM